MQTVKLDLLVHFLAGYFNVGRYPADEQGGVFRPSDRPVGRIGLAVEPWPGLNDWLIRHQPDALWIHRPWKLDLSALPVGLSILYHHLPFDEHLTMGFSRPIAKAFQLDSLEEIGYKQAPSLPARPIGMIGRAVESSLQHWISLITNEFGGFDSISEGSHSLISRVAVVGAMNEALIREAADQGVQLYLTGQYRPSAGRAVAETGMSVIAVGHGRSEAWGLRALAGILQEGWPELEVVVSG
ncbi:hypothetical protein GCM10023189_38320 [Nibrella saemangeumensis]|uniref:NGG1p interacting factor NIF3 n=1 Tax=Nibrella saemangeumensis TaxID=1084526 RepID=A0ABP8NAN0_9BACT